MRKHYYSGPLVVGSGGAIGRGQLTVQYKLPVCWVGGEGESVSQGF
jgi:hypothetical protein